MIKIMIVDDSLFLRAVLRQIIHSDPKNRFQVVAAAVDGVDALEKLQHHEVDVITMDVEMPTKNGLETVKEIMARCPKPVLMLSSKTEKGAAETIEALSLGAVDFITKPGKETDLSEMKEILYEKLEMVSRVEVGKKNAPPLPVNTKRRQVTNKQKVGNLTHLIAIGTSTGGPNALRRLLAQIPEDFPAGIVIVQHMPEGGFIQSLAESIQKNTSFHTTQAIDGEEVEDGKIIIAKGGFHLEMIHRNGKYCVVNNKKDAIGKLRPAVDVLFTSIADIPVDVPVIGVILTGMGSDGLLGVGALKEKGAVVIAESEETCVVYGMPRKIAEHGLADYVEKLDDVFPRIIEIVQAKKER